MFGNGRWLVNGVLAAQRISQNAHNAICRECVPSEEFNANHNASEWRVRCRCKNRNEPEGREERNRCMRDTRELRTSKSTNNEKWENFSANKASSQRHRGEEKFPQTCKRGEAYCTSKCAF